MSWKYYQTSVQDKPMFTKRIERETVDEKLVYKGPYESTKGVHVEKSKHHKDLWVLSRGTAWWSVSSSEDIILSRHKPKSNENKTRSSSSLSRFPWQ